MDSITGHIWRKKGLYLAVKWADGDLTWEPAESCLELAALTEYLTENSLSEDEWEKLPPTCRSKPGPHVRNATPDVEE